MKKIVLSVVVLTALTMMAMVESGCTINIKRTDSKTVKQGHDTDTFTTIIMSAACNVTFEQSDSSSIMVEGDEEDVKALTIENNNGQLTISTKKKKIHFSRKNDLKVTLRSPKLEKVQLEGAGNFEVNGPLESDTFVFSLDGAGNMKTESVKCNSIKVSLNGAGNVKIKDLTAQEVDLEINGAGNMSANLTNAGHVNCESNGVGNITLKGNAETFSKKINGVGHVNVNGLKVNIGEEK